MSDNGKLGNEYVNYEYNDLIKLTNLIDSPVKLIPQHLFRYSKKFRYGKESL
jgi:hypothetical protein